MARVDREHTTHHESCGCAEAEIERLLQKAHCNWCGADVSKGPVWCSGCSGIGSIDTNRKALEARIRELEAALRAMVEATRINAPRHLIHSASVQAAAALADSLPAEERGRCKCPPGYPRMAARQCEVRAHTGDCPLADEIVSWGTEYRSLEKKGDTHDAR